MIVFAAVLGLTPSRTARADEAPASASPATWYAMTVISGRAGFRVSHYWSRGASLRVQTISGVNPIITIVSRDRYAVYDALTGQGIEIKRSESAIKQDVDRGRPFGNELEKLIQDSGEQVGTEVVSGVSAEVWRRTNASGRRTVWVAAKPPGVPLRVESFDRQTGETATLSYSNWASNFDIPDGFFELPANLSIRKFEYDEFVAESLKGTIGRALVLYPELVHGRRQANSP